MVVIESQCLLKNTKKKKRGKRKTSPVALHVNNRMYKGHVAHNESQSQNTWQDLYTYIFPSLLSDKIGKKSKESNTWSKVAFIIQIFKTACWQALFAIDNGSIDRLSVDLLQCLLHHDPLLACLVRFCSFPMITQSAPVMINRSSPTVVRPDRSTDRSRTRKKITRHAHILRSRRSSRSVDRRRRPAGAFATAPATMGRWDRCMQTQWMAWPWPRCCSCWGTALLG